MLLIIKSELWVGKKKHIAGFMSKALNATQRNWTTIEK
jgi:hypothetical protein